MNNQEVISIFENPSKLELVDLNTLEEIVNTYPFFGLARVLLTKKMQQAQHLLLKKEIKRTSVSIPNRKFLYTFLYQKGIQKTIIEAENTSQNNTETKPERNKLEEIEQSSFSEPISIDNPKDQSQFTTPISLKDFGVEKAKEIDILEQQIIGQTIEHVLTLEIENQHEVLTKTNNSSTESKPTPSPQKFSDWLNILDEKRLKSWRNPEEIESNEKSETDIINSFLQNEGNIVAPSNDDLDYTPSNLARLSVVDDEEFVTETLANIYAQQGNLEKALTAYKKLLLKYPEKKTYFAARIEKIEKDLK